MCKSGFMFTVIVNANRDLTTKLCGLSNVGLANSDLILTALEWYAKGVDLADALHLAQSQACSGFVFFDRKFFQKTSGKGPCKVQAP